MKQLDCSLSLQLENLKIDVSLKLSRGIHVVFGPSGSGKTTLLDGLAGKKKLDGDIIVNNIVWQKDDMNLNLKLYKRNFSYIAQSPVVFCNMTVDEVFQYTLTYRKNASHNELSYMIEQLEIKDLLCKNMSVLSGGERQKVWLILAFLGDVDLALFDEVTSGLDLMSRQTALKFIKSFTKAKNMILIYVTHSVEDVLYLADSVHLMQKGQIVDSLESVNDFIENINAQNGSYLYYIQGSVVKNILGDLVSVIRSKDFVFNVINTLELDRVYTFAYNTRNIVLSLYPVETSILNCIKCVVDEKKQLESNIEYDLRVCHSNVVLRGIVCDRLVINNQLNKGDVAYASVDFFKLTD